MKTLEININNWKYSVLFSSSDHGSWPRQYATCIKWIYNEKTISINIRDQTLWSEAISPNGRYLILTFNNFSDCNCKVFKRNGEISKTICSPFLLNRESTKNHFGKRDVSGEIVGVHNPYEGYSNLAENNLMIIKIAVPKRMHRGKWTEHRIFDPETGEIGELLYTDVSEEL